MLKKTLIATTTAGLIAAGSLATATGASATVVGPGHYRPHVQPVRICQPVFKNVTWWWFGQPHWRVIKVGEKCHWVFPPKHVAGPFPWHGPNAGPHPGPYPTKPHAPYPY